MDVIAAHISQTFLKIGNFTHWIISFLCDHITMINNLQIDLFSPTLIVNLKAVIACVKKILITGAFKPLLLNSITWNW